ncbi:BON domain-containing protein [Cupriavidus sp. WKF15]|uniref:BON domain-containing protein n=1 Tax=Cupriavidus sp. WKF15 TaxID=3032282 RepID=UPI0023E0BE4A|nr:BON domain-containing protein [Cupriavidus sp. WKF15]WER48652.1 BON domain-containing protein [Cupriavidus sp. WKF15]
MFNFRKGRGSGSEVSDYARQQQARRAAHDESRGSGSEDWGQEWGEDWRGASSRGDRGEQGYGAADMGGPGHPYSGAYRGYQPSAQGSGYQAHEQEQEQRSQRGRWGQTGYDTGNYEGSFDPGDDAGRMQAGHGGRAMHWDEGMARDRAQRGGQPSYGGGYFGDPRSGGQSYSGGQRLYPDDRGSRPGRGGMSGAVRRPVGPKGYRRPDERVREDVCERLATNPYVDVSDVSVEVSNGVVMLEGTVMARREKYVIEEIAEAVFGVTDVENRLRVQRNEGTERAGPVAGHLEEGDTSPDRTLNKS